MGYFSIPKNIIVSIDIYAYACYNIQRSMKPHRFNSRGDKVPRVRVSGISIGGFLATIEPTVEFTNKLHTLWKGELEDAHNAINNPEVLSRIHRWQNRPASIGRQRIRFPGIIVSVRKGLKYQQVLAYDKYGTLVMDKT